MRLSAPRLQTAREVSRSAAAAAAAAGDDQPPPRPAGSEARRACARTSPGSSHDEGDPEPPAPRRPLAPEAEAHGPGNTVASSQAQGGHRKKGCGAPKRKLRRPLLPWGRKLPPHGEGGRAERGDLCWCAPFPFHSQRGGRGISSRAAQPAGSSAGAQARPL